MPQRPPSDTDPITLAEACEIVFRGTVTPATLRAQVMKGNLTLLRVGRQDFTTIRDVREMIERCRVEKPLPGCTSIGSATNGLSATARDSSAQAVLDNALLALRRI